MSNSQLVVSSLILRGVIWSAASIPGEEGHQHGTGADALIAKLGKANIKPGMIVSEEDALRAIAQAELLAKQVRWISCVCRFSTVRSTVGRR